MRGELEFDSATGSREAELGGAHGAIAAAELRADIARMRLVGDWAFVMWAATLVPDLIVSLGIRHASPVRVLAVWLGGMLAMGGLCFTVRRPQLSRGAFVRARGAVLLAVATLIAVQASIDRGMQSAVALGLVCVAFVQAITSPMPLRRAAVRLVAVAVVGLAVLAALSPHAPADVRAFVVLAAAILASVLLLAIGSDAYWRLRRQVFASRVVGRYRLVERIGKGGMGEVWRARHPGLRRDVAVKILRGDRASADQVARFEAEIAALSELSHPNVVRVYDSGVTDDGLCYYAMELLLGETLDARVRRAGPLAPDAATALMRQIARALGEAHALGIVHRDLTPHNVFLAASAGGELAKLIDFGIAARTTERAVAAAGTPAYAAPEQARGEPATPAADLYALGAVWYFALTGRAPFAPGDADAAVLAHAFGAVEPPSVHAAHVPPAIDAVIVRCLAKAPAARYPTARAIEEALGGPAVGALPIPATPQPEPSSPSEAGATAPGPGEREDREDRAAYVRLSPILRWSLGVWIALGALDLITGATVYLATVRACGAAIVLACVLLLRRGLPSPRALAAIQHVAFTALALGCALVATGDTGPSSPRVAAIVVVLVAQGLAVPCRMREGLVRLGATLALFTAVMWAGVAIHRPTGLDLELATQYAFATCIVAALLAGAGHAYWSLRQQLFEARVVGRYRLGRMLGAGGMGQVWTADHPGLGREVAVKLLRPADASPALIARFETEIHALAELASPHTVRVYDCGTTDDGYWYYVMERLEGATLTQVGRANGVFAGKRAIRIARQVATALAEAHAAGIVHRDLKPDNLFLTTVGDDPDFVKVLDFGVAKRAMASRLTRTGIAVGTPAFMAPEQALAAELDGRADIYALGAVLFHMLTGRPPFTAESSALLMFSHVHDEAPRLASVVAGVPVALDELVARCLAKAPEDRPASMVELERELGAIEGRYEVLPVAATAATAAAAASPVAAEGAPTLPGRKPVTG